MKRALLIAPLLFASSAAAQTKSTSAVDFLSFADEMAMALSAAPKHLQAGATVYVLTDSGFVKARDGTNGFACVVNRDHPLNRKPACYDAEGTATILPKVLFVGNEIVKGTPMTDIEREVNEGFASGRFIAPRRPGVAYMLTPHIRRYDESTGTYASFPPHIMFYAPGLTNADIGASFAALRDQPYLPFVAYQGPHGFMVVVVGDTTHSDSR